MSICKPVFFSAKQKQAESHLNFLSWKRRQPNGAAVPNCGFRAKKLMNSSTPGLLKDWEPGEKLVVAELSATKLIDILCN